MSYFNYEEISQDYVKDKFKKTYRIGYSKKTDRFHLINCMDLQQRFIGKGYERGLDAINECRRLNKEIIERQAEINKEILKELRSQYDFCEEAI